MPKLSFLSVFLYFVPETSGFSRLAAPNPTPCRLPHSPYGRARLADAATATRTLPTPATTTHRTINPAYPDLPLDKYLANPYFAKIRTDYPGLQLIHEEPFLFLVHDFLTADECARLRRKADTGTLRPQFGGGAVERTSSGVVCVNDEVPTLRTKLQTLTGVSDMAQLQPLKISKYRPGQVFSKHTDAWPTEEAPVTRGWVQERDFFGDESRPTRGCYPARNQPNHNTLLTCFVYLNTVHGSGYTTFPNIGLHQSRDGGSFYRNPTPLDTHARVDGSAWDWEYRDEADSVQIAPTQGLAVLHFCSVLPEYGGICDGNVLHVAEAPLDGQDKYVAQQFVASCTEWSLPDDSIPYGRVSWDTI